MRKAKDEILELFVTAVIKHERAILEGDSLSANKLNEGIRKIYHRVKKEDSLGIFSACLDHPNDNVKLYAASFYLEYDPEVASVVLRHVAGTQTIISMYAKATLDLFEKGEFIIK